MPENTFCATENWRFEAVGPVSLVVIFAPVFWPSRPGSYFKCACGFKGVIQLVLFYKKNKMNYLAIPACGIKTFGSVLRSSSPLIFRFCFPLFSFWSHFFERQEIVSCSQPFFFFFPLHLNFCIFFFFPLLISPPPPPPLWFSPTLPFWNSYSK